MKVMQIAKRISLMIMVNLLIMTVIMLVLGLLGVGRYVPSGGLGSLAVICLVWGFGGAFISLAMSRLMAKWFMGVKVIPPETNQPELSQLVRTVHDLARRAGLEVMPEVGIYESPEVNAFATGPSRSRALVAASTGLLRNLRAQEVAGVLGHEIAHVANGDMVTMTLIQGVVNSFVLFLAKILAFVASQAIRSRDDRGGSYMMQFLFEMVFQVVFSLLGSMVVCWFSRWREFRADAGGAQLAGRANMVEALRALKRLHDPALAAAEAAHGQAFQSLKISGKSGGLASLFSTHPPLDERIARLEQGLI